MFFVAQTTTIMNSPQNKLLAQTLQQIILAVKQKLKMSILILLKRKNSVLMHSQQTLENSKHFQQTPFSLTHNLVT